jgi:hypothetical protein
MYKTINGWTKQKMIDHVIAEFRGRSVNTSKSCQYRGPNGKKCAIGMFIPDSIYKDDMDGILGRYSNVATAYPKINDFMPLNPMACKYLQDVHDGNSKEFFDMSSTDVERTDDEVLSDILNFIYAEVED